MYSPIRKLMIFLFLFSAILISLFSIDKEQIETQARRYVETIIIDPAHGGMDFGAIGKHIINGEEIIFVEKEITLGIAQILKEKLMGIFPDIKVILTREDDIFISLEERTVQPNMTHLANNALTLFISIHTNAAPNSNNRGYMFSVADITDENLDNFKFAEKVNQEFSKIFENELPFLGIMQNQLKNLNTSSVITIISDIGFITNIEDVLLLYSEQGLEKSSIALANGIAAYIESL